MQVTGLQPAAAALAAAMLQLLSSGCLHPSQAGSSQEPAVTSLLPGPPTAKIAAVEQWLLLLLGKSLSLDLILQHQKAAKEGAAARV